MSRVQESLGEKTIALEQTQERLHAEQRSYDRKLTSITSEYERNLNGLINHTAMSGLLQTAINRTEEGVGVATPLSNSIPTTGGSGYGSENAAAAAGTDGNSAAGAELVDGGGGGGGVDRARAAVSGEGVGDTTQHAMTKVLHERWLSEREKARTLEARLSDAEARMSDMDEVRKIRGKRGSVGCSHVGTHTYFVVCQFLFIRNVESRNAPEIPGVPEPPSPTQQSAASDPRWAIHLLTAKRNPNMCTTLLHPKT